MLKGGTELEAFKWREPWVARNGDAWVLRKQVAGFVECFLRAAQFFCGRDVVRDSGLFKHQREFGMLRSILWLLRASASLDPNPATTAALAAISKCVRSRICIRSATVMISLILETAVARDRSDPRVSHN